MSFYLNADEMFEVGLEIEGNGQRFYALAAERAVDAPVKALCRELAEWEGRHVSVFETLRKELPAQAREDAAFDPGSEEVAYVKAMADNHVFLKDRGVEQLLADCQTAADLLDLAISFEKDSVLFYTAIRPLVPPEHGQQSVDTLIREEMGHIATLTERKSSLPGEQIS